MNDDATTEAMSVVFAVRDMNRLPERECQVERKAGKMREGGEGNEKDERKDEEVEAIGPFPVNPTRQAPLPGNVGSKRKRGSGEERSSARGGKQGQRDWTAAHVTALEQCHAACHT